jgi:hypothetical protein
VKSTVACRLLYQSIRSDSEMVNADDRSTSHNFMIKANVFVGSCCRRLSMWIWNEPMKHYLDKTIDTATPNSWFGNTAKSGVSTITLMTASKNFLN